jgi:adenine specific DNA methylase Mod
LIVLRIERKQQHDAEESSKAGKDYIMDITRKENISSKFKQRLKTICFCKLHHISKHKGLL